jgi:hypothetical protein
VSVKCAAPMCNTATAAVRSVTSLTGPGP